MSYTLGQQVVLTTLVTDNLGTPTNATMSLTVTKPDGSTLVSGVGLTISTTGTGAYACNVPATLAGTYLYLWTASGAAIGVDDGQFDVLAITRRISSLADIKLTLNKNNTADDVELQDTADAAQAMIQREIGPVVPTSFTETLPVPSGRLILTHRPVISITSITTYAASTPVVLSPTDYRLDQITGLVERVSGGGPIPFAGGGSLTDITVVYLAGRTGPVAPNIGIGHRELTAHLWRNSQMGRAARRGQSAGGDDVGAVGLGFSLPNRVKELIGAKQAVIF